MALDIRAKGTATLSPTQVLTNTLSAKHNRPYVDIANADTRSFIAASSTVVLAKRTNVKDVLGDIGIEWEILTNTQARVYATRGMPADSTIVFDWVSYQD
jgi:hypothetical protein